MPRTNAPLLAATGRGRYPPPKRTRTQLTVSLPPDLVEAIDREADREQRARSQIVEFAVIGYLKTAVAAA